MKRLMVAGAWRASRWRRPAASSSVSSRRDERQPREAARGARLVDALEARRRTRAGSSRSTANGSISSGSGRPIAPSVSQRISWSCGAHRAQRGRVRLGDLARGRRRSGAASGAGAGSRRSRRARRARSACASRPPTIAAGRPWVSRARLQALEPAGAAAARRRGRRARRRGRWPARPRGRRWPRRRGRRRRPGRRRRSRAPRLRPRRASGPPGARSSTTRTWASGAVARSDTRQGSRASTSEGASSRNATTIERGTDPRPGNRPAARP